MAITSGFYNSVDGDRKYNADQVNNFFEGLVGKGVIQNLNGALKVSADTGMQIQVATGKLMDSKGRWLINDAIYNLTIDPADVTLNRYDAVVAAIDSSTSVRGASIYVKKGTIASSPTKPTMTRSATLEEYCLAYVYIGKGVTTLTQTNITDTRSNNNVCGWVTGLIEQVDTSGLFDQYQTAYEENKTQYETAYEENKTRYETEMDLNIGNNQTKFDNWFNTVKETLATATLIRSYFNSYTTTEQDEYLIPIGITQFNKELDIFQVYVNGLKLIPNVDYVLNSNNNIVLTGSVDTGTVISFEVFKSIDGSDAETVVSQVNDIQNLLNKYSYIATGENDNVLLSQTIQTFLNAGDDYAQLEIDVIGSLNCSVPCDGDGTDDNPAIWFAVGQSTSTTRRVRLNFAKCNRITVNSSGYSTAVLFGGNDIFMRNCQAVMNNVTTGKIFNGERVTCDDSEFWLNGIGALIGGDCCGTFTNCRMSVTSSGDSAVGFSANGNVLRLVNCEILAYNSTSVSAEANAVLVEANKTENVLIMTGCNVPITARNGYKQSNTVKINNGYYCLTGNILGKAAAKYLTGDDKTEIGTMIISK